MRINSLIALFVLAGLGIGSVVSAATNDIAYLRLTDNYWQAWITDPNGLEHRQVTTDAIDKTRVSWSPDRKELLVNRNDGRLIRVHLGTNKTQMIDLPVSGMLDAQWSPDGQWVAFSMISTTKEDTNNLWMVKLDGTGLQKLNNQPELQLTPAWSPSSKKITYTAGAAIDRHEIWTIDLENRSLKQITLDARGFKFDPAFSPKADIAYSAEHNGNYDLWVINNGSDKPRQLTTDSSYDGQPSWSPDGKQLAFSSLRGGEKRLWIMEYAGGEAKPITPAGTVSRGPAWFQ